MTRGIWEKIFVLLCLTFVLPGSTFAEVTDDDLRILEHRIDALERTVESLQDQVLGQQAPRDRGASAAARSLQDPLVGTWQCTNNVFNYDITFLADGRLLQESPTFGKVKEGSWERISDDVVLITGGQKLRASFSSSDNVIIENLSQQGSEPWNCQN